MKAVYARLALPGSPNNGKTVQVIPVPTGERTWHASTDDFNQYAVRIMDERGNISSVLIHELQFIESQE